MLYKTEIGIKQKLSTYMIKLTSILFISGMFFLSCNNTPDDNCMSNGEVNTADISEEGRSFMTVFESDSLNEIIFEDSIGNRQVFVSSGMESMLTFENVWLDCNDDGNFFSQNYEFEVLMVEYFNDDYFIEITQRERQIFEISFLSGIAERNCLVELFQVRFDDPTNGGINELRVETEQNSCFSGISADNFEFISSIELNNRNYEKVYSNVNPFQFGETSIKFYYTKEKGLVAFTDFQPSTWTLVE